MLNHKIIGICAAFVFASFSVSAQDFQLRPLQRNIDIFSGILEEVLELKQTSGLFGMSLGGVDSTYLYGQGVVLQVRTPLANTRNRMSLASLNSALQSLQFRTNPFESIQRPLVFGDTQRYLPLILSGDEADGFYKEMMDKISNIDYSLVVNTAIQQASEAARSLRSMGSVDESVYQQMRAEIANLRDEMQSNLDELREIEGSIRSGNNQDGDAVATEDVSQLRITLDEILARIEPLRERALAQAADLSERTELARQEYAAQWQQDVIELETNLYAAMCDYGSTLRELPETESISIILTGLGEEAEDNRRTDKVHVFSKADVLQCQSGEIDLATLQQRTIQYSY